MLANLLELYAAAVTSLKESMLWPESKGDDGPKVDRLGFQQWILAFEIKTLGNKIDCNKE